MQGHWKELNKSISKNWPSKFLLACFLFCSACREQIVHDLAEPEANRLLTSLHEEGIAALKTRQSDGKWTLAVPHDDVLPAIKYLEDTRRLRAKFVPAIEKKGVLSSREDQRFRFERELSREIEYTLMTIEGVLEARVHLNLPLQDSFLGTALGPTSKGSASVLLVVAEKFTIPNAEIEKLVAGASGVQANAVNVLATRSDGSAGVSADSAALIVEAPVGHNTFEEARNQAGAAPYPIGRITGMGAIFKENINALAWLAAALISLGLVVLRFGKLIHRRMSLATPSAFLGEKERCGPRLTVVP